METEQKEKIGREEKKIERKKYEKRKKNVMK